MLKNLLPLALVLATVSVSAQSNADIFTTTGTHAQDYNWSQIKTIGNPNSISNTIGDLQLAGNTTNQIIKGFGQTGLAALAYDGIHNRLYFSPLFSMGNIVYIDLDRKDGGATTLHTLSAEIKAIDRIKDGEGPNITRMTMAPKNLGYALSNDGNLFYQFNTKNNQVILLGALVDAPENAVSVHDRGLSWGGDMIADEDGNLYLFSMFQQVFKITPQNNKATYIGKLLGISENFKINGAAVTSDNEILFGSSTMAGHMGKLADINNLNAAVLQDAAMPHASDMASKYFLKTSKSTNITANLPNNEFKTDLIGAYPNPVVSNRLTLSFNHVPVGDYTIDMLEGNGAIAQRNSVKITTQGQLVTLNTTSMAKGFYIVKVVDAATKEVWNKKVIIQ